MAMAPAPVTLAVLGAILLSTPPYATSSMTLDHPPLHHDPRPIPSPSPSPGAVVEEYTTYIVLLKPRADAHLMDDGARQEWYRSFLPTDFTSNGDPRLVRSYKAVFHGFAALLTPEELDAMSRLPGFGRSFPDGTRYTATTRTPGFLGLEKDHGLWPKSSYGKGVVIGVLDSGINWIHPSFDDTGMSPPPARWKGWCEGWVYGLRCNHKLVGARSFLQGSPWDEDGHGTHVASTAAGNFVANASSSLGGKLAAGIAPGAHIAVYKVCRRGACSDSAIINAIDAALQDGVDVLSFSFGYGLNDRRSLDKDAVAIGAFRAVARGVIVVAAAGNNGPEAFTVENDAPWLLTVGAGSVDRRLPADMVLENGDIVQGEALTPGENSTGYLPLYYPGEGNTCTNLTSESPVKGRIVICDMATDKAAAGVQLWTLKELIYNYGAAHVVLVGRETSGYVLMLRDYGAPVVQQSAAAGRKLKDYSKYPDAAAQVLFRPTELGVKPAPIVAAFSGRGPSRNNQYVIKPDVLAPGLNILAAAGATSTTHFTFDSGTSMAAPHVSGVAALLRSVYPEWSPAAIRSAITSTTESLGNDNDYIKDQQHAQAGLFAVGSGLVSAVSASLVDIGLVYDIDARDYAGFLCYHFNKDGGAGVDLLDDVLLDLSFDDYNLNCSGLPRVPDYNLNYPTIMIPANKMVQRTLTNVGKEAEVYYGTAIFYDETVTVDISPTELHFSQPGQKLTFNLSAEYQGKSEVVHGLIRWESPHHRVYSKIVVQV